MIKFTHDMGLSGKHRRPRWEVAGNEMGRRIYAYRYIYIYDVYIYIYDVYIYIYTWHVGVHPYVLHMCTPNIAGKSQGHGMQPAQLEASCINLHQFTAWNKPKGCFLNLFVDYCVYSHL